MKYASIIAASLLAAASAFTPTPAFTSPRSVSSDASSSTVLHISSWGTKGSAAASAEKPQNQNPEEHIQAYLKAPDAVEARANIDGTVLVSGLVKTTERTDQELFDFLNHEESAFEFDKIVAFVDDMKFAKKRLLSRSARYTGLLNKLDFIEATSPGSFPTLEQLEGVKSWVVFLEEDLLEGCKSAAALAKEAPSVENLSILLTNAVGLDAAECKAVVDSMDGVQYNLVAVGKLEDHAEGKVPYKYDDFGTEEGVLAGDAIYSRDEAMRMITELLQLECGVNKALSFSEVYDVNATEAKLIKGLREAGYARPQEIDHMVRVGPGEYQTAIDEFRDKNPDWDKGYYTTEAWWEDEKFQKSVKKSSLRKEEEIQKVKDERAEEIEAIAKEWGKREYFRQTMAGDLDESMTEEAFIESVWDRAMFEGDLKYRQMNGEQTDAEGELENFKAKQERKKQAMLKRAKAELQEMLDEEDLGGEDLNMKLDSLDPDADNTEK